MKVIRINSCNAFCVIETPFNSVMENRAVVKSVKRHWYKTGFATKTITRKVKFEICAGWGHRFHEVCL